MNVGRKFFDKKTNTVVVGGGQAGLAMSAHLRDFGIDHLVIEKERIAERWRSARWDSLVMNGPAWHDRFPAMTFDDLHPDSFPGKKQSLPILKILQRKLTPLSIVGKRLKMFLRSEMETL